MKILVVICAVILIGLTVLAVGTLPERRSEVPLLWWTTDNNPARGAQIKGFEEWMVRKGYGPVDLELDSNNRGTMKIIIQSVSGVGSELVDVYDGGRLRELVAAGVLMDVTDLAREYGFSPDKTYASVREEITVDGRQYTFPCNVAIGVLTINRGLLERENLPLPKFDWTWDEFLKWCLAVRKVDANGRVIRYAMMPFWLPAFWRTNAGTIFNETMTRCTLDSPQVIEATRFYYDLMFKHKVMPTRVAIDAMAAESGFGGAGVQWVGNELAVGLNMGRYGLIQLRRFKNFKPDAAMLPHKVMPINFVVSRSAGITAGASNPRLAGRFLQYLAGESYNRLIINDSDGMPPSPKAVKDPEFLNPSAHPGEQHVHEKYHRVAAKYSASWEYSRFVNPMAILRIFRYYITGLESRALSIEDAMRRMTDEINREIRHAVERDVKLQPAYKKACDLQKKIDQLKKEGKPVPIEWISNPVLRRLREAGK